MHIELLAYERESTTYTVVGTGNKKSLKNFSEKPERKLMINNPLKGGDQEISQFYHLEEE